MSDYIEHLEQKLHIVDRRIERAKSRFGASGSEQQADALVELSRLRQRHDELVERVNRAKAAGAENWSDLRAGLRAEADGLADALEKLLIR